MKGGPLGLGPRLALLMAATAVATVALSMALVYRGLDERLARDARAQDAINSAQLDRAELLRAEDRALHDELDRQRTLSGALAVMLGVSAAAIAAATLVRPIRRLTESAERIAAGDLGARAPAAGGAELARLAGAFNRLAAKLAREDELRRAAAADIAHELRTPVSGIVARIEAAQDGVMDDPEENLEAMHAEAVRLARLIDDVGQLADAEQPELRMARQRLDVGAIATARAAVHAGFFDVKGIAFEQRVSPAWVVGDAHRLEQVIDNLLSNALRYTDPGGRVELRVARRGGDVIVEVRDSGIGIAPEEASRVFDRFWRSDRSRSRATGGAGIGLAVVRELVRAHGGRVELDSALGRGSTFRAVLPGYR
jgi:signal transduction histidine kinase